MSAITIDQAILQKTEPGKRVNIMGAGVAGLSAEPKFLSKGVKPIIFEGLDRPGGRVLTVIRVPMGEAGAHGHRSVVPRWKAPAGV